MYFTRPIHSHKVTLKKIYFTASDWPHWFPKRDYSSIFVDSDYVPYNLGHDLYVQIELYGCPNYSLDHRKYVPILLYPVVIL